jgi:phosphate transport system substrate-binding protein
MKKILILLLFLLFFSCNEENPKDVKPGSEADITTENELRGAGATFPYPLYSKMFSVYSKKNNISINYKYIGSGGGIRQLIERRIDFGATDAYLSDKELEGMPQPVVHIPSCLGSVAISYNIHGNPELKLTPEILAGIFLGKIKKWNDTKIAAVNPEVNLPDTLITVIHRSDGSGSTFIFTNYLSEVSKEWKEKAGNDKSVNWPVGLGGQGNEGVSRLIQNTPGGIGYIELTYAVQKKIVFASIKNKSGNFISPSLESAKAAAKTNIPDDTRISLTNSDVPDAYPISSFSWLIIYKEQYYNNRSRQKAKNLINLVNWIIHEGQLYNRELMYSPLPENVIRKSEAILRSVTYNDSPLFE